MREKGFSAILLLLLISSLVVGAFFASFKSRAGKPAVEGVSSGSAQIASDAGKLPTGSARVTADLEQINVQGELDRPETQKIQMKSVAGILEVTVIEATGEGQLTRTGQTDSVHLQLGDAENKTDLVITPLETGLELTSKRIKSTADFSLSFNKSTKQLMVDGPDGPKFIRILPHQALEVAKTTMDGEMEKMVLVEAGASGMGDSLVYKITGRRIGNLLGLFQVKTTTETSVGAQSGLVIETKEPFWLKFLSPLII